MNHRCPTSAVAIAPDTHGESHTACQSVLSALAKTHATLIIDYVFLLTQVP